MSNGEGGFFPPTQKGVPLRKVGTRWVPLLRNRPPSASRRRTGNFAQLAVRSPGTLIVRPPNAEWPHLGLGGQGVPHGRQVHLSNSRLNSPISLQMPASATPLSFPLTAPSGAPENASRPRRGMTSLRGLGGGGRAEARRGCGPAGSRTVGPPRQMPRTERCPGAMGASTNPERRKPCLTGAPCAFTPTPPDCPRKSTVLPSGSSTSPPCWKGWWRPSRSWT
jgi:hypothetical protein